MNTPTLHEYLTKKLEQKRKEHPSFRLMKIDDRLFPNAQTKHSTLVLEARNSNDELKTVAEIVAESWERGDKNHLMIEGEGGIGKTVTLLSIPDKLTPFPVPAIYIPLHELPQGDDPIERYIKKRVLSNKEDLYGQLLDLLEKPWDKGPQLMLLLDGFNEIAAEKRPTISEEIKYWSEFQGIQIVTSSRYDIHTYVSLSYDYSTIKLQPLSDRTVEEYLNSTGVPIPVDNSAKKLITIPLLLTLYVQTALILEQRENDSSSFKEVKNAGSIVWNYLQCELWRFGIEDEDAKNAIIAMEFIAPYMAWQMQQNSLFFLNQEQFNKFLEDAYKLLKSHFDKLTDFRFHIQDALQKADGIPPLKLIRSLLEKHLCLFVKNGEQYRLMHQQFRDALAAMHLINSIYLNGNSRPTEWNPIVDHYVMLFVADLISEEEANRLWEQNRTSPQLESAIRNQLELQRRFHNCDFSNLNFSGLDLSNISLFPYRINNTLKLPIKTNKMAGIMLSEKTFSAEGHKDWVCSIAIIPDGRLIISGSLDRTIRIWDSETNALIRTIEGHTDSVNAVAVTLDGKQIVSGSADKTIRIWDLNTGHCKKVLHGHTKPIKTITLTSDGKFILSGSSDATIRIWELESGKCIKIMKGHKDVVQALVMSMDQKHILSGSFDKTIRIWELESGECIKTLYGHSKSVYAITVTHNGRFVISGSADQTIRIWDLESLKCIKIIDDNKSPINSIVVTPDDKYIISGSSSTIGIWDWEKRKSTTVLKTKALTVAITPNGKRFVSGFADKTIRIWDLRSKECIKKLEGNNNFVKSTAVNSTGQFFVTGSTDNIIRIWDVKNLRCSKTLMGHKDSVTTIAISSDNKLVVSGSLDKTIRIWNLDSGDCTKILEGHKNSVTKIALSPNNRYIASGSSDHTIRIWDLENGNCTKILEGHESSITALAFSPNGKNLVSGSYDSTIRIWNLDTGFLTRIINVNNEVITTITMTPDSRYIVNGSLEQNIRFWDFESGNPIVKLVGHKSKVITVAVTSDGKHIISGSDNAIQMWDLKTMSPTGIHIKPDKNSLNTAAVDITPKGNLIISGTTDGKLFIIHIDTRIIKTIQILPLIIIGLDFSNAIISDELKETLRQNGAKVDPD